MAGSRLEKFGTVYTRVRDLMRAGVIKQKEKPIWFDVYAAFPPKREPSMRNLKFFEVYGSGPRAFEILKPNFVSPCQKFVMKYNELESRGDIKPKMLFEETAKVLLAEGIYLRKRGGPVQVSTESRDPLLNMKLTDMLAEQQRDTETETNVPEKEPQAEAVNTDSQTSS